MIKPTRGRKSESHLSDYIRLGSVLQKDRSALKQDAVEAVLKSRASLRDKIDKINRIDQSDERYAQGQGAAQPAKNPEEAEPDVLFGQIDEEEQNELRHAKRKQQKLIKLQVESRLTAFLFREFGRIRRFGLKTGMLTVRFPFRIRLSPGALDRIASDVERVNCAAVVSVLDRIIQNGWRVLEKYEYNCVGALLDFYRGLSAAGFRALNPRDRFLLHRLKDMERQYLVLHGGGEIREAVFSAFEKIIDHYPGGAAQVRVCAGQVQQQLAESESRPTIGNLILGLNMIRWRRFFVMADLADAAVGDFISAGAFDCPDKVRVAINEHIEEQEGRLKNLFQERARLVLEIKFFPVDGKGDISYAELTRFYSRQADPDQTGSWKRDSEQVLFLLVRIIDIYIVNFRPLLCGMLVFEPSGSGGVFDGAVFDADFDLLAHVQKQLERHTFSFGSISRTRYQEIRDTHQTATRIEAEAFSLVTDILSRLHAIAYKIVLSLNGPVPESGGAATNAAPAVAGSPPIAHAANVIRGQGAIAGRTVLDALRFGAGIAYGIGLYLSDPSLWGLIQRETPLKAEVNGIMRSLKRIASVRVFADIQKRYGPP